MSSQKSGNHGSQIKIGEISISTVTKNSMDYHNLNKTCTKVPMVAGAKLKVTNAQEVFILPEGCTSSITLGSNKGKVEVHISCVLQEIQQITLSANNATYYLEVVRTGDIKDQCMFSPLKYPTQFLYAAQDVPIKKIVESYNAQKPEVARINYGSIIGLETMQYFNQMANNPITQWPADFKEQEIFSAELIKELAGDIVAEYSNIP